jgi:hypothetical protein
VRGKTIVYAAADYLSRTCVTALARRGDLSVCVPVIETPEHIAAAELATRELNAPYPARVAVSY